MTIKRIRSVVSYSLVYFLLTVVTARAQDIRGNQFIALTRSEKVTFIQHFADEYATNYDTSTAEQIKTRYHTIEPNHDLSRGVAEAIGYSGEVLARRDPHTVSMNKVLSRVLELQFGTPNARKKDDR